MVKKPTLIVLLCAVVLGGAAYYLNWRQTHQSQTAKDTSKPALSIQPAQISSIEITHPSQPSEVTLRFEKKGAGWTIVQPVATAADQASIQGLVDELASARSDQSEPGSSDRLKAYGLAPPRAAISLQMKDGTKHTVEIGDKEFTGASVYTVVDGGQNVLLLPAVLGEDATKSLDDLRDRAVLHIDTSKIGFFALKNGGGEVAASKNKDQWQFTKPSDALADNDSVGALLSALSTARMVNVASETPDNLAKYGLTNPAVALTVTNDAGQKETLLVGKKEGDDYDARDASRPTIFRINADLYKKLTEGYGDFRDRTVAHVDTSDIQHAELHTSNGVIAISRKKDNDEEWVIDQPADQKGKTAASWKIFDPVTSLKADDVLDHPSGQIPGALAKPDYTIVLTKKDGKELTIRVSKPVGDFVYAQTGNGPAVYKLKKELVDGLNLKGTDLVL